MSDIWLMMKVKADRIRWNWNEHGQVQWFICGFTLNCWDSNQSAWWLRRVDWDGLDVRNKKMMHCPRKTWWGGVNKDMKSFSLSCISVLSYILVWDQCLVAIKYWMFCLQCVHCIIDLSSDECYPSYCCCCCCWWWWWWWWWCGESDSANTMRAQYQFAV